MFVKKINLFEIETYKVCFAKITFFFKTIKKLNIWHFTK